MRAFVFVLVFVLVFVFVPALASAQAPLVTGLGGPLDFGTDSPPRSDDDTMPTAISLSGTFPSGIDLYGVHLTDVFVNVNGSLTFGAPIASFDPTPFPRPAGSVPMIAGWWANVDTRPVPPTETDGNQIYFASTPEHFVVTWIDVGYFDQHIDHLNAFQIILSPTTTGIEGAMDVELRYHRCEWTTGDDPASGGTNGLGGNAAQAGFDAGDGEHYAVLPGSGTAAILSLCTLVGGGSGGAGGGVGAFGMTVGGPERCGNGFVEPGEECDDGNTEPHDFCDDSCMATTPCYTAFADGGRHDPFGDTALDASVDASTDAAVAPCDGPDAGPDDDAAIVEIDVGRADAGRRPDAGTRFDAGPRIDSGEHPDGGGPPPNTNALDVTGGACGCRAGGNGRASSTALSLLIAWVMTRVRRRLR